MPNGDEEQGRSDRRIRLPDDGNLRNRIRLQEALHSELDKKSNWLMQSEQDLLKIFRFYLVVLGAYISALSLLVVQKDVPLLVSESNEEFNALLNLYTASATFFWVVAVVGTVVAYVVIQSSLGVNELHRGGDPLSYPEPFDHLEEAFSELNLNDILEQPPEDFEDEIIYNYVQSLRRTGDEFTEVRYPFLWGGMLLVSISVLAFGFGVVHALTFSSELSLWGGPLRMSPLGVHIVGITVLVAGLFVSDFLIQQMLALRERICEKVESSRASKLFPGAGALLLLLLLFLFLVVILYPL